MKAFSFNKPQQIGHRERAEGVMREMMSIPAYARVPLPLTSPRVIKAVARKLRSTGQELDVISHDTSLPDHLALTRAWFKCQTLKRYAAWCGKDRTATIHIRLKHSVRLRDQAFCLNELARELDRISTYSDSFERETEAKAACSLFNQMSKRQYI